MYSTLCAQVGIISDGDQKHIIFSFLSTDKRLEHLKKLQNTKYRKEGYKYPEQTLSQRNTSATRFIS